MDHKDNKIDNTQLQQRTFSEEKFAKYKVRIERQSPNYVQNKQNNDLNSFKDPKERLEKQNHDLQEKNKNLLFKLEEFEKMNKIHVQSEKDLQLQVKHYQKKIKEIQIEKQQVLNLCAELQKVSTSLSASSDSMDHQLKESQNLNHELNSKIQELQKENKLLASTVNKLSHELTETKKRDDELNSKLLELQAKKRTTVSSVDSFNRIDKDIIHLKKNQDGISTKLDRIQLDIDSLFSKFTLLIKKDNELSILAQLDQQFKKILEVSFDYEEELDSKYIIINEMENKLMELSNEIEMVQNKKT